VPYSGSGTFTPYTPGNPVISGAVISATDHNNTITDIASGLSNAVTRDGQSPPSANLPMASFKLTGLGAGTTAGDSVRYEQVALNGANNDITSLTALTVGGLPSGSVTPTNLSQPFTRGTSVATTSGTSIDFTGIPVWVKRITIMLNQVGTSGTSPLIVRVGTSSGIVTTNYRTAANLNTNVATSTTGFLLEFSRTGVSNETDGMLILTAQGDAGLSWQGIGNTARSTDGAVPVCAGSSYLGGVLDRVRLTTVGGADTFDNGSVNILYE